MVSRRLDNSLNQTLVILFQPQRGVNQIVGFRRFINRPFDCSSPENSYLFQRTNSVPSGPYDFSESAVIWRTVPDREESPNLLSDEINHLWHDLALGLPGRLIDSPCQVC